MHQFIKKWKGYSNLMSKRIYSEWLFPVANYLECLSKKERNFEMVIPAIGSFSAMALCAFSETTGMAIQHMNSLLPTVFSILIGFTISAISIIASASNEPTEMINKPMGRGVCGKQINFKQWFLSNLIYYIMCEILFLFLSLLLPLVKFLTNNNVWFCNGMVLIYCYAVLRTFFGIIKVVTKLYQVYFINSRNNDK